MAKIEPIILDGKERMGFNIHESVGTGGRNKTGDVIIIQAMLNYIEAGLGRHDGPIFSSPPAPELTGAMDSATKSAIDMFQLINGKHLVAVDFVIHPAKYKGRKMTKWKPLMTITRLHVHCLASAKKQGHGSYPSDMIRTMPKILPWLLGSIQMPKMGVFGS